MAATFDPSMLFEISSASSSSNEKFAIGTSMVGTTA